MNQSNSALSWMIRCCFTLIALSFSLHAQALEPNLLESVRLWRAADKTRLVFEFKAPFQYKNFALNNPERLVLDFAHVDWQATVKDLNFADTPLASIRQASRKGEGLRV